MGQTLGGIDQLISTKSYQGYDRWDTAPCLLSKKAAVQSKRNSLSCFELDHFCHLQQKCSVLSNTQLFRDRVQKSRQEASEARRWHRDSVTRHKDPKRWFSFLEEDALETIPRPDLQVEFSICILWVTHLLLNLNAEQTKQEAWEVPQFIPQPRSMAGDLMWHWQHSPDNCCSTWRAKVNWSALFSSIFQSTKTQQSAF